MIKKAYVFLPIVFLVILIFLILNDFLKSTYTGSSSDQKSSKLITEQSSNNRDEFIAKNFVDENEKYLNKSYYDNFKFSVFKKDIDFKKLSNKTKSVIFISKCISIKKEAKSLNINSNKPDVLKKFEEQLQDCIDKEKKFLYEQYGSNVHPLDKLLLDKLYE